jgi:membrane-bound lytic murein transglycosylase D
MKTSRTWPLWALIVVLAVSLLSFVFWTGANPKDQQKFNIITERAMIASAPIPDGLDFAGERVPLEHFEVYERMDRELSITRNMHASTVLSLKRAHRWKNEIQKVLREEGVPEDMFYLMLAESGAETVTSFAAAQGFWQFIPTTARLYGLEISDAVDERNDPIKSARAACRYLKSSYAKQGSWTLAAAAYNAGDGAVDWIQRQQGTKNFYDLYMNLETSRYVFRILSFKLIEKHPDKYGFKFYPGDLYHEIPQRTVAVDYEIPNLVAFAKTQGTTYRMLKFMNPWMLKSYLPKPVGKVWQIRIATETKRRVEHSDSLNQH